MTRPLSGVFDPISQDVGHAAILRHLVDTVDIASPQSAVIPRQQWV